jgi:serine/threonine-protein kinase
MAPEQFEGRAVFASDLYSLGVTMFQMLTGTLPYETPSPADLERLRRGDFVTSPRLTHPAVPPAIDDVVMRALHPEVSGRYPRAEEMLTAILSARQAIGRRSPAGASHGPSGPGAARSGHPVSTATPPPRPLATDARGSEPVANRFCWHCRKPLPARTARCPFCGEGQ